MRNQPPFCRKLQASVGAVFLLAAVGYAQTDTATLAGTVHDPTGAVVAGASVALRSQGTGLTQRVETNELGQYVSPPLRPGDYRVTVEKPGFRRAVSEVALSVGSRTALNFRLQLGAVEEQVTVEATAALIESESSTVGNLRTETEVRNLPLNTRNFSQLIGLAAGSVPAQLQAGGLAITAQRGTVAFSVNGIGFRANNYRVDGLDNMENHNGQGILIYPPVEAIQEFRVQTSVSSAEFGRGGGGSINVAYKSGTRELHGSLFEFLRNGALDAKNFFDPPGKIPAFRMNQFGATLGGPVLFPGYNRNRDKTFFFFSYEGERRNQALTYLVTVPLPAFKQGDFSASSLRIFDPLTTRPNPAGQSQIRDQFPGNRIPANRLDRVGQNLMNLFPEPNRTGPVNNFGSNPGQPVTRNNYDFKIDQNFSPRDQAFFRLSRHFSDFDVPGSLPLPAVGTTNANTVKFPLAQFVSSYTRTFTPTLVNELRAGVTRLSSQARHLNWGRNVSDEVGIPGVNVSEDPYASGLTRVNLAGYEGLGDSGFRPAIIVSENYQFNEALTWVRGAHTFKFGGEIGRRRYNIFQDNNIHGDLTFGPIYTTNPASAAGTGISLADLLLGKPSAGIIAYTTGTRGYRRTEFGFFAQDTWKLSPSLTLTYGLRYEAYPSYPWIEVGNRMAYFRRDLANVFPVSSPEIPQRSGARNDWNNWGPRFGLAWKLRDSTVVRAAYGIFYSAESIPATSLGGANPPFVGAFAFNNNQFDFAGARFASQGFERPVGLTFSPLGAALQSIDPGLRQPYVQQWNFGLQQTLPARIVFGASYVGTGGRKLALTPNINQPVPGAAAVATRRPFPQFNNISQTETSGSSSYHSLQLTADRRLRGGLNFQLAYTWAHSIGNGDFLGGRQNLYDLRSERGNGNYDLRHRLTFSNTWQLPFGHGRKYGSSISRAADLVLGGWALNGISSFYGGLPFTPGSAVNTLNGSGSQRPDRIANGALSDSERTVLRWFDAAAFRTPAPFTFGNSGVNILTGPGTAQFDLAAAKSFSLSKDARRGIEFRGEMFNIFNTPQFNNPNASIGSQQAGVISSAGSKSTFQRTSRQVQMVLKLRF
ncbi:MAG: TonB-dependent receptor [Acidobacteria bacterium]|nr:TonB-dependent receptor [Acidobacteriota bacterium]